MIFRIPTWLSGVLQKIYGKAAAVGLVVVMNPIGLGSHGCTPKDRPPASGETGVLYAYAQTSKGPVRLQPGREGSFLRPQDIAFQFSVEGTGPRFVRVELEAGEVRSVLYEEKHEAPAFREALPLVVRLDERHPDRVGLTVFVEAPHRMTAVSRFFVRLVGPETRFWEEGP